MAAERILQAAVVLLVAQIPFELRYTWLGLTNLQWTFVLVALSSAPLMLKNHNIGCCVGLCTGSLCRIRCSMAFQELPVGIWQVFERRALGYKHLLEQSVSRATDRKRDSGISSFRTYAGSSAVARGSRCSRRRDISDPRAGRCVSDDYTDLFRLLDFAGECSRHFLN